MNFHVHRVTETALPVKSEVFRVNRDSRIPCPISSSETQLGPYCKVLIPGRRVMDILGFLPGRAVARKSFVHTLGCGNFLHNARLIGSWTAGEAKATQTGL
jgi:hypothetical protein